MIYQLNARLFVTDQQRLQQTAILNLNIVWKSERTTHPFRQAWLNYSRLFAAQPFNLKCFALLEFFDAAKAVAAKRCAATTAKCLRDQLNPDRTVAA